ncbi:hypothetical protein Psal006b_00038 [Piscirickettsia salmonis]|uniref:Uncharacterized protein n=4 Tax=Piscirickettsia salmonis TaxID=1238 RepID=A0A1L6TFQ5_PISSA|nr:hypothetical protein PSLF89_39 [Piscirickettsia salmonis LF-89 = ATCC VR-1361]ALB24305.1 hypothetical protein KU39_3132 [Piscirickettsia salmonis]ALY04099.1 hypothetical protein AWE47_15535 [Piscirickettsia salmonis]AMA43654.1 hypothetical protein AWJ11_15705 [Piscirickettsia salmonis]AOS36121.1 hypothetical protein AVM72_12815 [Piscirickettsia salmonis]
MLVPCPTNILQAMIYRFITLFSILTVIMPNLASNTPIVQPPIEQGIRTFLEKSLKNSPIGCTEFQLGKQPKANLTLNPMVFALAQQNELIIQPEKNNAKYMIIQLIAKPKQLFKILGDQQRQFCYAAVQLDDFNFYKTAKANIYHVSYSYQLIPINNTLLSAAKKMGPLHISNNTINLKKAATGFKQSSVFSVKN